MGEVYKAVDTTLGRIVAIKIPTAAVIEDAKGRQRFLREAHAASRLQHPNICTIFEVGEENGCPFIVMEYVDGPTLHQMISGSSLEIEPALKISLQIADALEEAHHSGIIHRDLKPSNVIINPRGMAMILDFGLAKRLRAAENPESDSATVMQSVTTAATVIGTVSYMSPEQVRAKQLDARSDVFAFGILMYEMLTGVRPFTGAGPGRSQCTRCFTTLLSRLAKSFLMSTKASRRSSSGASLKSRSTDTRESAKSKQSSGRLSEKRAMTSVE